MKKLIIVFSCLTFFLTACSSDQQIEIYTQSEEEKQSLEDTLKNTEGIVAGTAIFVEDELLVAIQVNPWLGFKERKVEKKLQKELEEQYPNLNVLVSTDYKLFWESNQLLDEEKKEKLGEEVKKLKDLAKEET